MSQGQCYGHPGEDLSQQVHNTAMRPAWSLTLFFIKSVIMKKETIKQIIQIVVTILTAISSTLFVQSCVKSPSSSSIAPQHVAISVSPSKTSGRVITPSFMARASATTTTSPVMASSIRPAVKQRSACMPAATMPTASASAMKAA